MICFVFGVTYSRYPATLHVFDWTLMMCWCYGEGGVGRGGMGWGGAITFMFLAFKLMLRWGYDRLWLCDVLLALAHTHTRHATLGWGGVGWGGVARNVQVYFHTHVMLRYCTAFLHLHKHVMLRYCTFFLHLHAHVMLRYCTFFLHLHTHTHTRHATVLDVLLALAHTHTHVVLRYCTFSCYVTARSSCTCTHTSCYATARSSCTCTHTHTRHAKWAGNKS